MPSALSVWCMKFLAMRKTRWRKCILSRSTSRSLRPQCLPPLLPGLRKNHVQYETLCCYTFISSLEWEGGGGQHGLNAWWDASTVYSTFSVVVNYTTRELALPRGHGSVQAHFRCHGKGNEGYWHLDSSNTANFLPCTGHPLQRVMQLKMSITPFYRWKKPSLCDGM